MATGEERFGGFRVWAVFELISLRRGEVAPRLAGFRNAYEFLRFLALVARRFDMSYHGNLDAGNRCGKITWRRGSWFDHDLGLMIERLQAEVGVLWGNMAIEGFERLAAREKACLDHNFFHTGIGAKFDRDGADGRAFLAYHEEVERAWAKHLEPFNGPVLVPGGASVRERMDLYLHHPNRRPAFARYFGTRLDAADEASFREVWEGLAPELREDLVVRFRKSRRPYWRRLARRLMSKDHV